MRHASSTYRGTLVAAALAAAGPALLPPAAVAAVARALWQAPGRAPSWLPGAPLAAARPAPLPRGPRS